MKNILLIVLRTILLIAFTGLLALFLIPMTHSLINIGNIAGAVLCVWVIFLCIPSLHRYVKRAMYKLFFTKLMYRIVSVLLTAFLVYGVAVTSLMAFAALKPPEKGSTAVILGAQVKPWGPSVILQGRVDAAEKYLKENPEAYAVASGGQGSDEHISEAQCIYDCLIGKGIAADRIFMEDKSVNTKQNLENSYKIIEENSLNSNIALVTDPFHQLRAKIIAYKLGVKGNVGAVNSDTSLLYLPTYTVREWFALPAEVLFR